jgi:hypothetical protein
VTTRRKHLTLKTKLASAIRELFKIDYEHAKLMTEDQILSLAQYDHGILHGIEVVDEHWNYTPRMILPHREKSRRDTAIVAKAKRIDRKWEGFMAAVSEGRKPPKHASAWPKGRKMQSRKFKQEKIS